MSVYQIRLLLRDYLDVLQHDSAEINVAKYGISSPFLEFTLNKLSNPWNLCFVLSLLPLFGVLVDIFFNNLGANPIQGLHIRLGDWSLRFLCITLAITPIQKITRWRRMSSYRQLFGLFCFFYASLHLIAYLWIDHVFQWPIITTDIIESSYIWFGGLTYVVIFLLAITSSKLAKKLMGKTWKKLHRYIYLASISAVIHYFWQLKGNLLEPLFYALIIFALLFFRIAVWFQNKKLRQLMVPKSRDLDDD
jgi:methionine sulfoxide reductase heme-binding subunit